MAERGKLEEIMHCAPLFTISREKKKTLTENHYIFWPLAVGTS